MTKLKTIYVYTVDLGFGNTKDYEFESHKAYEKFAEDAGMNGKFHKVIITNSSDDYSFKKYPIKFKA